MAEFLVKVADESGRVLQQVENGTSETEVRDRFVQQGYLVYSVKSRRGLGSLFQRKQRIKPDTFVIFNQQLVTLIKAGLPILTSLELLAKRQRHAGFKALLENVRERVKGGQLLSESFAAHAAIPRVYTTSLLAGERSGNIEEVLSRYVSFQRVTLTFRRKLLSSLIYPAILISALILMFTFLITYVVPQFAELYNSMDAQLPPITVFMLSIGTGIQRYYEVILLVFVALVLGTMIWVRSTNGARVLDAARFKLPKFGEIWMKYQVAMFSRTLSTLLSGGLPLVPALETASSSINSYKIASNVDHAASRVREGRSLAYSLEETGFFPELAIEMIEVGESTGALAAMLNSIAEFYEEDVQHALTAAMQLIEPVILIIMGLTVAFVLISLYLPIFSLGSQLQQH